MKASTQEVAGERAGKRRSMNLKASKKSEVEAVKKWKVKNKTGELLYGDLTEKVIGLCYKVHRQYGSGQKESVYQNALEELFEINEIPNQREVSIAIRSEISGKRLGSHRLDFVVEDKIILETKAIIFTPVKLEQQLYSYLKNSKYEVGLMVNFGSSKLYVRRIVLTASPA